jgi:hypothetical protein
LNTFRHSGKLGDIIYSLPAVRALGGGIFYVDYVTEYPGKSPLGIQTAKMMVELLDTQDYIRSAALYEGEPIIYDLDRFRKKAVPAHIFNVLKAETDRIAGLLFGKPILDLRQRVIPQMEVNLPQFHWESAGLPGRADLDTPWLNGIPQKSIAEIVISRTGRYPGTLDWSGLKQYASRSVFVGLEEEWQAFQSAYFNVGFYKVSSLLDFAQVVSGAKLYVGNQSFGLALADAMLIPRVAELWGPNPIRMSAINGHHSLKQNVVEAYINS